MLSLYHTTVEFEPAETNHPFKRTPTGGIEIDVNANHSAESEDEDEDDEDDENFDVQAPSPVETAFNEIKELIKEGKLKLHKKEERKKFFSDYEEYLLEGRVEKNKNLLHVLADWNQPFNSSMGSLVSKLTTKYPKLLVQKDDTVRNPLYVAISDGRAKLVSYLCENKKSTTEVTDALVTALSMKCSDSSENCLHAALRSKLPVHVILKLIEQTPDSLKAQDSKGFTPLHYAVEYGRCTQSQFEIVTKLIECGDSALDMLGGKPDCFSVYRYHLDTRPKNINKNGDKSTGKRQAEKALPIKGTTLPRMIEFHRSPKQMAQMPKEMQKREDITPKGHSMHINADPSGKSIPMQNKPLQSGQVPDIIPTPDAEGTSHISAHPSKTKIFGQTETKSKRVEEEKVTDESAEKIREFLQLHYLRTRRPEIAARLLYGKNPEGKQTCFDLLGGSLEVDPEQFKVSFQNIKLDSVLQYVAFPSVRVHPAPALPYALDRSDGAGKGRCDLMFFFQWLRQDKGVKRILKVIVEDSVVPAHSDEAIESALHGFGVEILDWRKIDLCSETIWKSSAKIREVYLRWSGNNAVLRGWSEAEGLRRFEDLTKVHLHVQQDLESRNRMQINIENFRSRLNPTTNIENPESVSSDAKDPAKTPVQARIIQVRQSDEGGQAERSVTMHSAASEMKREHRLQTHRWLSCMDSFQDLFQNVWNWTEKQQGQTLMEPVEIALIDDGVNYLEPSLLDKMSGGLTFDYGNEDTNLGRQYYVSATGHGTVMAKNIIRICPMAKIYVIKLETYFDHKEQKARIGTRCAADAINAAVDRKVQIISMSWTVQQPNSNSGEKEKFDSAVRRAVNAGILLFCSAADKGLHQDNYYPAASDFNNIIKIGAAKTNGDVWEWVPSTKNLDFIIPGDKVMDNALLDDDIDKEFQPQTGSSVATALGVGLAALVICCVQLAAIHTEMTQQDNKLNAPIALTLNDLQNVKKHENMKAALQNIGTSVESKHKFIEVWRLFDTAIKDLEGTSGKMERLRMIASLALNFRVYG